jgi:hypothetical protein
MAPQESIIYQLDIEILDKQFSEVTLEQLVILSLVFD